MSKTTAILFFSRTATAEAQHKQLFRDQQRNERLLSAMIARSRELVRQSGMPAYWITEKEQQGATFGAKLYHAAQFVLNQGHDRLIIIGNDSPQLQRSDLTKAQQLLESGKAVLGKNRNGGAYLIGLQAEQINEEFQYLPWQTNEIGTALDAYFESLVSSKTLLLRQSKRLASLRSVHDLNHFKQWSFLKRLLSGFRLFACVFFEIERSITIDYQGLICLVLNIDFNRRGPPVLC